MTPRTLPCPSCDRMFGSAHALADHKRMTHDNATWTPGKSAPKRQKTPPICPACGSPATITATRYGPRAACCGLHSWDLKPLVAPETHRARNAAHKAFDALWQGGTFSRGEGYRRLQIAMGMTSAECHIAQMSAEQAARVVEIVRSGKLMELADA